MIAKSGMEPDPDRMRCRSLWFPAVQTCEIREEALATPVVGEALVRMLFSGVSRGTESLVFAGRVPVSEFERMRGPHMGGSFHFPVKYGYASVGRVEAGPDELVGTSVFCLHPHQDVFIVEAASLITIPDGVPAERAVLAPNMETALNIVWDAAIQPGDKVAVFGAGVVGSLVAYIASRIIGTEVHLVDRNTARRSLADRLGIDFSTDAEVSGEFDVLINASGSAEALSRALELAGHEARIIEASWHGDRPVSLPLGGAFHARRLTIASSQVGSVPPDRRARWNYARRLAKALELLRDDCVDALISGETDFSTLETDYPAVLANPETLCHRIRYTIDNK